MASEVSGTSTAGRTPGPKPVVKSTRHSEHALAMEVGLGDYREVFFVLIGERSVAISSYDETDPTHPEPAVFVFPKPYQWSLDLDDDELMVQIWQATGVQR